MKIHILHHDPIDFAPDNITLWSQEKGYRINETFLCNQEKLPSLETFDWLIIMGGSQHAWDEEKHPWLIPEKAFIAESVHRKKTILGICFGTQLLAEVLGGEVYPNPDQEIGWFDVSLTTEGEESFLFRNVPQSFISFHWHSDHYSLPPGCTCLARTEPTPNQAFVCKNRPLVGLQFHPEITRAMADGYAKKYGHRWRKGKFVPGRETVLKQTETIPDTYWLMAAILDNMVREFNG